MGEVITELQGGVTSLRNTYQVDGRVSWHDPAARGFATANCYLLQDDGHALLIDTGLGIHRDAVCAQVSGQLMPGARLSIMVLRQGEFDSVCNLLPLVERVRVNNVYGQFADPLAWGDFISRDSTRHGARASSVGTAVLSRSEVLPLGASGERQLVVFRPVLRLLSTHWIYDPQSRALFTSDSFCYGVQQSEDGPWVISDGADSITVATVTAHLRSTRYWWLAESDVDAVRRDLAAIRARFEIEHIAPAFGAMMSGNATVKRHFDLMDQAVAELGRAAATGLRR